MLRTTEDRVFIAGAGPVGMVAAAYLVQKGIPVTVFESSSALSQESRASTFHPSTLDILEQLGLADELTKQGVIAPSLQYRLDNGDILASLEFSRISDLTNHPYRVHCEQFKLTQIIHDALRDNPHWQIEFGRRIRGLTQDENGVSVEIVSADSSIQERRGRWLIGADGASSLVRKALGIPFEGFTWQERFLVITTPYNFETVIPHLDSVTYVATPKSWHVFIKIPSMWRVTMPVASDISGSTASSLEFAKAALRSVVPDRGDCIPEHSTIYKVHQRVAKSFRIGRVFLAGDAAHINNPLGGMGMNGGIHDAANLAELLTAACRKEASIDLDRYDRQRRLIALEHVQAQTIRNKLDLEASDGEGQKRFRSRMKQVADDPHLTREFLRTASMIASLERAAEIA